MTSVSVLVQAEALLSVGRALGLQDDALSGTRNALIAQSVRRSIFINAPCNARSLKNLVTTALSPLLDDVDLAERVSVVLENMIATGDVLEMRRQDTDQAELVLRPAPPTFVKRSDGTFIILGVAGDEITPNLQEEVDFRPSGLRTICPDNSDALCVILADLGLIELAPAIWLHAPPTMAAADFLQGWIARLPRDIHLEKIDDLEIIDTGSPTTFYKGRWRELRTNDAGTFLARRPQKDGPKLWSFIEAQGVQVRRLVDVHAKDVRIRDCDEAWRIQAALDARAGSPQTYKVQKENEFVVLSFYSPLPAWAVRRLSLIGEQFKPVSSLLGFRIPAKDLDEEMRWLGETLWLTRDDGGTG